MKKLEPLQYVQTAVSTDAGRYNLDCAWRQDTRLVATDGHRMHWVERMAAIEGYQYLDGRDTEPPRIDSVIRPLEKATFTFAPEKDLIKSLKTLCKLTGNSRFDITILEIVGKDVRLLATSDRDVQWSVAIPSCTVHNPEAKRFRIGVQLPYLVDALIPTEETEVYLGNGQIRIKYNGIYHAYNALIMPIHLNSCDQ